MKIFENNYEIDGVKFLYSTRILKILRLIQDNNKHMLILTPLTKYSYIFNFKKDNLLNEILNFNVNNYKENMVNEKFINDLITKINYFCGFELLDYNFDYDKIVKTILEISDKFIEEKHLDLILNKLDQFMTKQIEVVISGFEIKQNKNYKNIDILYLVTSIKNQQINFNNLESVWIDNSKHNQIFIVEDQDKLISWLELESKKVITNKELNNYLQGYTDFSSFLIENSLQKICEIDL